MNQDDILRELELLPVWQSRQPIVQTITAEPDTEPAVEPVVEAPAFRCIVSTDVQWAFVLEQQENQEAETLLQNILKAVQVKVGADDVIADFGQSAPRMIVVMGEALAQQLLATTQTLTQMRGEVHNLQGVPTVVTFSPSDLLSDPADKAKAWEDLCLAKFTIANL